jgi:glutamyl-tRNA reductase
MQLFAVGINHKKTPIEIREQFCLSNTEQELFLSELKNLPTVVEAFVLSTCNRVEVYAHVLKDHFSPLEIIRILFTIKKIKFKSEWSHYFYHYQGEESVRHLLRVASGLDSLIIGEKQILGQIKKSFELAQTKGMFSKCFNLLSNIAIRTGKKAHSETNIGTGGSSVSWAAITMAEKLLGTFADKSAVIIGAGKMGELAINQILNRGIRKLYLMNRTGAKADHLAEKHGVQAASFSEIRDILSEVDVCVCSASAPHFVLDVDLIDKVAALRNGRELVLLDISMPRNINPAVSNIRNVILTHIDDLQRVVENNMRIRMAAIDHVEGIIAEKISEFHRKMTKVTNLLDSQDTLVPH